MPAPPRQHAGTASQLIPGVRWTAARARGLLRYGFALAILGGVAVRVQADAVPPAIRELKAALGEAVQYSAGKAPAVRYCPDNTCEVFRGRVGGDVADFALVYLWHVSDYAYLVEWRTRDRPARIAAILADHTAMCRTDLGCVLLRLQKRAGIAVAVGRYDEGRYTEERAKLTQELGRLKK